MDDFALGQEIGRDVTGSTRVFVGRKRDALLSVAVKKVAKSKKIDDVAREATLLCELRREDDIETNVLRYYEYRETINHVYLILELCGGGDLRQLLVKEGVLGVSQTASLGRDLANALHHCESNGVVHGDVRPKNLLLTSRGSLRLCGFGGARRSTRDAYSPPEYAIDATPTHAADVWSLGVVLYECLSGYAPFREGIVSVGTSENQTTSLLAYEVLNFDALKSRRDLSEFDAKVAKEFRSVVRCATEREPFRRARAATIKRVLNELI